MAEMTCNVYRIGISYRLFIFLVSIFMSELSDEGKMFHFYVYGHKINVCHFMHAIP